MPLFVEPEPGASVGAVEHRVTHSPPEPVDGHGKPR